MKCSGCNGRGFKELHYGLVMVKCPECKGTGEIDMEDYGQVEGMGGVVFPRDVEGDPTVLKDGPLRIYPGDTISGELKFAKGLDYDAANPGTVEVDKPARVPPTRKPPSRRKRQKSRQA